MNRLEELKEKTLQGDILNAYPIWAAIVHDSEAVSLMIKLSEDARGATRSIAIGCLDDIKNNPEVTRIMMKSFNDPVQDIRQTAASYFYFYGKPENVPQLIPNLNNPDDIIRGEVALTLGNLKDPQALPALKERFKKEPALSVQKDIMLARAKLGDKEMKEKIVKQLSVNDSQIRFHTLEDLKYVDDKALAWYFLPALDDKGNTYMISDLGREPVKHMFVCDLASDMVAAWYPGAFSFQANEHRNFSKAEIEQVKKFVSSLKKP